ncbi:hypothetical protein HDU78_011219 [Chytriomyces hyalinus]|nr:hypothetical protein HDU78_011219 [Chytriomyces hyalinus]
MGTVPGLLLLRFEDNGDTTERVDIGDKRDAEAGEFRDLSSFPVESDSEAEESAIDLKRLGNSFSKMVDGEWKVVFELTFEGSDNGAKDASSAVAMSWLCVAEPAWGDALFDIAYNALLIPFEAALAILAEAWGGKGSLLQWKELPV